MKPIEKFLGLILLMMCSLNGQSQTIIQSGVGNWEYFVLNEPHPSPWPLSDFVIPAGVTGWNSSLLTPGSPWFTNYVTSGGTPTRMWTDESGGQVHGALFRIVFPLSNVDGAFSFDLLPNNECTVFINGTQVGSTYNWVSGLQTICVPQGLLHTGNNLVAMEVTEWTDDATTIQFLLRQDFSLSADITPTCTNTGAIDLVVNGSGTFTYNWSGPGLGLGVTTQDLSNLVPGVYTVTVTDNRGCSFQRSYTVDDQNIPPISIPYGSVPCHSQEVQLPGYNDSDKTFQANSPLPPSAVTSNGLFKTAIAGPGSWQVYQTVDHGNGCITVNEIDITVDQLADPIGIPMPEVSCSDAAFALPGAGDANITFDAVPLLNPSAVTPAGMFIPGVAGQGAWHVNQHVYSGACEVVNDVYVQVTGGSVPFNQDYYLEGTYQSEGWVSTTVETCDGFIKLGNWAYTDVQDGWYIMLTWFDGNGDVAMTKKYQGPEINPSLYGTAMVMTEDEQHVIITGQGNAGLLAMKVRISDGAVIWSNNYDSYIGLDICATENDEYAIAGKFSTYMSILSIDGNGNRLWHNHYSGIPEQIYPQSMCYQPNGQAITVAGVVNAIYDPSCSVENAFFTFGVDLSGNILNNFKIFDYYCGASGIDVNAAHDGGYVITNFGEVQLGAYGYANLLKLDPSFNVDWNRIFTRVREYAVLGSAVQVTDDGYDLAVTFIHNGSPTTAGWVRTDKDGHFVTAYEYGTTFILDYAMTSYMIKLYDGGYLINGETFNDWGNNLDGYHLIRIKEDGSTDNCFKRVNLRERDIAPDEYYATLSPTGVENPQSLYVNNSNHETRLIDCDGQSKMQNVAINDPAESSFSVAPNPGDGRVSISFALPVENSVDVSVYDVSGRVVYAAPAVHAGQELQLDLTNLPQGLYTIRVLYSDGSQEQQRYLKQ